jgi:hypothetical protein
MGIFQQHNKVCKMNPFGDIRSQRYDQLNPVKLLLDIVGRKFSSETSFFISLLYILQRGSFHPEIGPQIIADYLDYLEPLVAGSTFTSRLALLIMAYPGVLNSAAIQSVLKEGLRGEQADLFVVLIELPLAGLNPQGQLLAGYLRLAVSICNYFIDLGAIVTVENYIRFITNNRVNSNLGSDEEFISEFRKMRSKYFQKAEENKGKESATSTVSQMFGFVKGIVQSTTNKAKEALNKQEPQEGEVKWCNVSKRWLINGEIPEDNEEELEAQKKLESQQNAQRAPPQAKKPPPGMGKSTVAEGGETDKKKEIRTRQKFVAYSLTQNQ